MFCLQHGTEEVTSEEEEEEEMGEVFIFTPNTLFQMGNILFACCMLRFLAILGSQQDSVYVVVVVERKADLCRYREYCYINVEMARLVYFCCLRVHVSPL